MGKLSQTLRIGLALFLAVFGTSAIPSAAAYALEETIVTTEEQTVAPPPPTDTTPPPPVEETVPPAEPVILPPVVDEVTTPPETLDVVEPPVEEQSFVPQSLRVVQTETVVVPKKVTICHRTASYTNPYVSITVDVEAADGQAGNSGSTPDHYGEHQGPLFSSSLPKHTEWGDIIPAIAGIHSGQNLANGGQAILDADCTIPVQLSVEATACTVGDSANGAIEIWVYGTANGSKLNINGVKIADLKDDTPMPIEKTGLAAGEYTITVTKGNDTLATQKVTVIACPPIEIPLPQASADDPCGPANATWIVPANTSQYTWAVNQKGELVVTTIPPYVFAEGKTSYNYGTPEDSNTPCPIEVTPVEPDLIDICYMDSDGIYIQGQEGVKYKVNGEKMTGWVEYTGTALNVTAEAKKGYVFPEGAVASWTFDASDFTDKQCLTITKSAKVASDTNLDGKIGVGDTVTWEITVTNTSDEDYESFYVLVDDPGTVLEDEGYIGFLGKGKSKTLTATSTITASDLEVCKVTNTATFEGWRAYLLERQVESSYDQEEEIVAPLATGSATATYTLSCPPAGGSGGGQVLGTTTVKTVTVTQTPQVLPATIAATGASDTSNIYLILGMAFSALTYFAMLRRYQEA